MFSNILSNIFHAKLKILSRMMFLVSTLLLFNIISYAKRSDTDDLKYFSSYPGFSVRGNSRQWEKILTEIRISISCSYMVQCDILKERKQTKNP